MANLSWISSNPDYINQMIRNTQVTLSNNYNDLDNIPIIKITSTTNNPQKVWELEEGLYMIDGVVQVDNNTSYEVSNLLISMTARLENGKYILSAFIPYLRGLFEYILKTNSTEYEQHQKIVLMIKNDTLALDNETIYTPIEDYHPATKKYVNDKANEVITELDRMGVNKENLESFNKENRIRDIKLQALLSETSDRNITIEENVRYFDMPLSIDNGIVTINEIVGETLVNVCDQEESVAITKSYTVENENHIALQGEYDGSCRPIVHGNTLVNHNADWDDSLQTGIETSASGIEDVQVEGIKGQEVSVVVEGNTVLNHALGKTSAVVSNVEDNLWDFNYIDTTGGNGGTITYSSGRIIFEQTRDYEYTNVFLDRKDIIKPNTYYTLIVDVFINTLPTDSGIILNSYSATTYPASDVFTIYGTSNDGREGSQNKIHGGDIGRFIYKLKSKSDFSVSQYALRTFIGNTSQEGELEFSIKLFEGDHTTNPKYVNSNNGNYVDLTVANDMSSVVEIEGRTMVNVCNQKDPIAITKSYAVENSGNHIALQGEYDGKCRPVIQGNTMVNLHSKQMPKFNVAPNTNSFNITSSNNYIKIVNDNLVSDSYRYIGMGKLNIDLLKPSTTYTLVFTKFKGIHSIAFMDGNATNYISDIIPNSKIADNKLVYSFITRDTFVKSNQVLYLSVSAGASIDVEVENPMIFEGDLTQTPELIPTEYVEGLKSSFEDNLVTQAMVDSGEESVENLGKYKVEYKVTGKNKWSRDEAIIMNAPSMEYMIHMSQLPIKDYTFSAYIDKNTLTGNSANTCAQLVIRNTNSQQISEQAIFTTDINKTIKFTFNSKGVYIVGLRVYSNVEGEISFKNIQLEEGSTATEYEPYKSYTKTFYLNSPLLEGDTIEDVNGVATHVKRYEKIDNEYIKDNVAMGVVSSDGLRRNFHIREVKAINNNSATNGMIANILVSEQNISNVIKKYTNGLEIVHVVDSSISSVDLYKEHLDSNPVTVVYELASPIYEPISTESILCDSYVNGHLDFDSAAPIEKVQFSQFYDYLKYLESNTNYILQFESDNEGILYSINLGGFGNHISSTVKKGINRFQVKTLNVESPKYYDMRGIGFNASNIVVTEATDADFDYFEGLKSSYECEVTDDGKYKVDVKVTGKNLFNMNAIKDYTGTCVISGNKVTVIGDGKESYRAVHAIIPMKKNTNYVLSYTSETIKGSAYVDIYDANYKYFASSGKFNSGNNDFVYVRFYCNKDTKIEGNIIYSNIQLEEGTEATPYEPYFESTKTFYLNSPLLEGDKIVTKNGKVYHYHKMGKVVLDGSEDEGWTRNNDANAEYGLFRTDGITNVKTGLPSNQHFTDTLKPFSSSNPDNGICQATGSGKLQLAYMGSVNPSVFKQWLQANPTTVVYELASPYYELIDEYNNTILNIPKNVAHLTHTSAVPVNNTVFTNYKDELNVLEPNTQYRLMFDCDTANVPFTVTLGGTSQEVTSKKGTHSLLITTPSTLVDKNLVIDGIGRCGIDNIRIFKGNVEYDYVKGLWSGYEERKLVNIYEPMQYWTYVYPSNTIQIEHEHSQHIKVTPLTNTVTSFYVSAGYVHQCLSDLKPRTVYTFIADKCVGFRNIGLMQGNTLQSISKNCTKLEKGVCKFETIYFDGFGNQLIYMIPKYNTDGTMINQVWELGNILILEGDWTDNPPTYEEVMANEGKYAVKVKLDNPNATIFGKGGRL